MLCNKLHCQKGFDLILFSCKTQHHQVSYLHLFQDRHLPAEWMPGTYSAGDVSGLDTIQIVHLRCLVVGSYLTQCIHHMVLETQPPY